MNYYVIEKCDCHTEHYLINHDGNKVFCQNSHTNNCIFIIFPEICLKSYFLAMKSYFLTMKSYFLATKSLAMKSYFLAMKIYFLAMKFDLSYETQFLAITFKSATMDVYESFQILVTYISILFTYI